MNKKGLIWWGSSYKQDQIFGVNLGFKCLDCKSIKYNITYQLGKSTLYSIIPLSGWGIQDIYIQCIKCGSVYDMQEDMWDILTDAYEEVKQERKERGETDTDWAAIIGIGLFLLFLFWLFS